MNNSDRVRWHYVPFESVGPLRFGMSHEEANAAMGLQGFTGTPAAPLPQRHGALVLQAVFREMTAPAYVRAVTAYYRESGGLACVAVDALCGPLVSMDGMQLVGRVPSELTDEFHDYQERLGMSPTIAVEGDAASDELGIMVRAQRAGDSLLSRPVFARFDGWAYTVHDCVPEDEWAVR
ncbi:hypothetical protein ACIHEI_35145 [Kitasatospora sp. NPDC051984]|uniref:hypothetical protein n=1 Tax=Kitasatospora sp. NPDC051984 TaxID=3364059 RepID=UPI0037C650F4